MRSPRRSARHARVSAADRPVRVAGAGHRRTVLPRTVLPRTVLIGTAFAGTLLLAGCSGGGATSGHTAAQEKKVTADLATIDSGLGGKDTLTDVKAICIQMQKHASDAALQAEVKAHFADHSISTMSGAEIAQIISTIKTDYCS